MSNRRAKPRARADRSKHSAVGACAPVTLATTVAATHGPGIVARAVGRKAKPMKCNCNALRGCVCPGAISIDEGVRLVREAARSAARRVLKHAPSATEEHVETIAMILLSRAKGL